jgi:hypothetical protein
MPDTPRMLSAIEALIAHEWLDKQSVPRESDHGGKMQLFQRIEYLQKMFEDDVEERISNAFLKEREEMSDGQ